MTPVAIDARALSKQFILRHNRSPSLKSRLLGFFHEHQREVLEEFWALRDISLTIRQGDSVGIVGRNGSGKSTLLKLIAGIHRPTSGHLLVASGARIGTMIELGVGFHPDLNGTENVFLNAAIHGLARPEIEELYPRVVEYSGLKHFIDVPIKNYSSGMHLRLGFAIAANLDPDILLLDEIFAVGDADFQKKCMATMDEFSSKGCTIIFVSHSPASVRAICRRAFLLDRGRLLFDGTVDATLGEYERLLIAGTAATGGVAALEAGGQPAGAGSTDERVSQWSVDFLTRQGLQPHHRVVEIGLAPTAQPAALARSLGGDRYKYWQAGVRAVAGVESADFILAPSVLPHLTLNTIARVLAVIQIHLRPGARFFATFFDAPEPAAFQPIERHGGVTTYPELEPYQYSFELLRRVGDAVGARVERVDDSSHPGGESVLAIERV